jgi:hypothetical protein
MKNQNKINNRKKSYLTYLVMLFALILTTVSAAQAATFTVNVDTDQKDMNPGDGVCAAAYRTCTLRAAIEESNAQPGGDNISFSNSFKAPNPPKTIVLTLGQLEIKDDLNINGTGARQVMIDGNYTSRVLSVGTFNGPEINVLIAFLTIQNGYQYVPVFVTQGAGIINRGNLLLSEVTIRNNIAIGDIEGQDEQGGGIANYGFLNLEDSTVSGNKAGIGAGIFNGQNGVLYAYNSTISDNISTWRGGGIYQGGADAWITNTTITNNRAKTDEGGGISNYWDLPLHMANTIVAGNFAPTNNDIDGSLNSEGNNLIENRGSSSGYVASDLPDGTNPLLGALQNNGGQTDTRALLAGSPAINAGNDCPFNSSVCSGWYDQRGYGFPRKVGTVDIGAFEFKGRNSAAIQISGKVLNPNGRGLNKAVVTLTDAEGMTRSVETDPQGNFSFGDVTTGSSYVTAVASRQYNYAAQTLLVTESRDDVNFVPVEVRTQ